MKRKVHRDWEANGIMISDHAVLRYLEIVYGFNMKLVRAEMVSGNKAKAVARIGTGKMPINGDGIKYVIRDGLIVTVLKRRSEYAKN